MEQASTTWERNERRRRKKAEREDAEARKKLDALGNINKTPTIDEVAKYLEDESEDDRPDSPRTSSSSSSSSSSSEQPPAHSSSSSSSPSSSSREVMDLRGEEDETVKQSESLSTQRHPQMPQTQQE